MTRDQRPGAATENHPEVGTSEHGTPPFVPRRPQHAEDAAELLATMRSLPLLLRLQLLVYLPIGAFGGLYSGFALTREYSNWLTWSVSTLILEPIGVACLFGFLVMVLPRLPFEARLVRALRRARIASVIVGLALLSSVVGMLLFCAYELIMLYW